MTPQILDSKGAVLEVGARVRYVNSPDDIPGEVKGPRWLQFGGWCLEVYWRENPGGERVVICHSLSVEDPEPNTYRTNDLTLIPNAKEKN